MFLMICDDGSDVHVTRVMNRLLYLAILYETHFVISIHNIASFHWLVR